MHNALRKGPKNKYKYIVRCKLLQLRLTDLIRSIFYVAGAKPFAIFVRAAREGAERRARSQRGEKRQPAARDERERDFIPLLFL